MKNKLIAVISAVMLLLCFGVTAYADSADTTTVTPSRTISTEGTGHVVDNISDGDKLQFISVTAKDGSVFFVVIDKQNVNDNVYFLNKVDVGDLEALAKDYKAPTSSLASTPQPEPSNSPEAADAPKTEEKQNTGSNNNMLIVLLLIAALGGFGAYYFKVYLPKKKLASADDIEDFEFIDSEADEDSESPDYESDTDEADYSDDTGDIDDTEDM